MALSSFATIILMNYINKNMTKRTLIACEDAMSVINKENRQCMYELDRCQDSNIACMRRWIR